MAGNKEMKMTFYKTQIKLTFYKIKEYLEAVAYYNDVRKKLKKAEKEITFVVRGGKDSATDVCIKKDYTKLPTADVFEVEPVEEFPRVTHCADFGKGLCTNADCPLYIQNLRHHNYKSLLACAENSKQAAYRELFHRSR